MSTSQELSVGEWLNSLNPIYNQYKKNFEDDGISTMKDFFDLSTVDDDVECFIKDIGITKRLHQNRLKREIKKFIVMLYICLITRYFNILNIYVHRKVRKLSPK